MSFTHCDYCNGAWRDHGTACEPSRRALGTIGLWDNEQDEKAYPIAPDYRDLARRLAEALREHRNCTVIQSREDGRFVCTFCGATAARKYVEHGYCCRRAKDRRLLAEAKEKLASEQGTSESKLQSQ